MRDFRTLALATALAAAIPPAASSHSLKDLATALGDREKYFQPVDKETPDFALQDPATASPRSRGWSTNRR